MEKRTLHLLRSKPDELVEKILDLAKQENDKVVKLYEDNVDWEKLIDEIFEFDKVISWW